MFTHLNQLNSLNQECFQGRNFIFQVPCLKQNPGMLLIAMHNDSKNS